MIRLSENQLQLHRGESRTWRRWSSLSATVAVGVPGGSIMQRAVSTSGKVRGEKGGEDATTTLTINTEEIIKNFNYIRLQYSFSITREED